MKVTGKKIVVTGGAGFIGSHLVDKLIEQDNEVLVVDNLSGGSEDFIRHHYEDPRFKFINDDLLTSDKLAQHFQGRDIVFHLAANPDVKAGATNPHLDMEQNIIVTHRVLEGVRNAGVGFVVFTSTSTVYGEAKTIPTPENYGPLEPISLYGASKLADEALITAYCHTFDLEAVIFRFANCVGSRSTHGVTFDFVNKLKADPNRMEILGDGKACKSYFHVSDCIDAMIFGLEHKEKKVEFFNVGSEDYIDVTALATIVVGEMRLENTEFAYTGGTSTGAGWVGDVKVMMLSIDALKALGWTPEHDSSNSIRLTARSLLD